MPTTRSVALAAMLLLAACGKSDQAAPADGATAANGEAPLPRPEADGGSVTGMPDKPGPGQVGPPAPASVVPASGLPAVDASGLPGTEQALPPGDLTSSGSTSPPAGVVAGEPTPQDAVAVVRSYYAAIDGHDYARAHALWSDGGRTSGQTLAQFAEGFAGTADVSVQVQEPGRIDAAAGSRYVQVPVTVTAVQQDGTAHQYRGTYTLRRAVVDGASAEQRAWRIGSADIRQLDR